MKIELNTYHEPPNPFGWQNKKREREVVPPSLSRNSFNRARKRVIWHTRGF